jgi:hypothetical protein
MTHNVILRLEGMPGASVRDIGRDMQATSDRLGIAVALDMNGTHLLTFPGGTVTAIRKDYETQLRSAEA